MRPRTICVQGVFASTFPGVGLDSRCAPNLSNLKLEPRKQAISRRCILFLAGCLALSFRKYCTIGGMISQVGLCIPDMTKPADRAISGPVIPPTLKPDRATEPKQGLRAPIVECNIAHAWRTPTGPARAPAIRLNQVSG